MEHSPKEPLKPPLPPTQRRNLIPRGPAHVGAKGPQDFYLDYWSVRAQTWALGRIASPAVLSGAVPFLF